MKYRVAIGLETHVQLKTRTKVFCACRTDFGAPPNTRVCPVCLGYPGAMPALNREAVRLTVQAGLMLGCRIHPDSRFDRKSYFYPDMPKNYQVSQYDRPLCVGGAVPVETSQGQRDIRLTRIHLEEDVGKCIHFERVSGVDFNRAGTPLMEIVSEPDIETAEEAMAYLQALRHILVYGDITEGNLEQGNFRCDVNCSLRPEGQSELGVKTELKNLNTFKGVFNALEAEIRRQIDVLDSGGTIRQETRRWDDVAGRTLPMRTKEEAHDYRYFPEPDLMPVRLAEATIEVWRKDLPELPEARKRRFVEAFHLPEYDAGVLVADRAHAEFFEATVACGAPAKGASNWIMGDVLRLLSEHKQTLSDCRLTPEALAALIGMVEKKALNRPGAKAVIEELYADGGDPGEIAERRGLTQVRDHSAIDAWADQAIGEHPASVEAYRAGKAAALQHLIGQVMRMSKGKADPQQARELLLKKLGG